MASPQKENGYTPIANELLEALCGIEVSGACYRVLWFIIRKTYGYNKKQDGISLTQFEKITKMYRPTIIDALDTLEQMGVVFIDRSSYVNQYKINKNYEEWSSNQNRTSSQNPTSRVLPTDSSQKHTKTSSQNPTYKRHKDNTKDSPLNAELTKNKMYTYHSIDESGNPMRKRSSGKGREIKARNAEYIKIGFLFEKLAEKSTGVKPVLDKAYFIIKNAREKLGVQDFEELFKYFFADKKLTPEQKVSLSFVLSQSYINQWRVNQKNKVVSQVEASADIEL